MQIHVLIPIPSPTSTGPDPPENIYHYTTGLKLKQIINSGAIKPTTAKIEPHEKPVAWFSTSGQWEPTASKIKQHLFCKSRSSEVGHLASMFR
jgi:hypothetical protein